MRSKRCAGFTLVEMLCAVVVLILVSMLMAVGIRLGVESYVTSVSSSEAQVLCSTLRTAVSDELRYSGSVQLDGSGVPTGFFSQSFSNQSDSDNMYVSFSQNENGRVTLGGKKFLPNKSYPYNLKASVELTGYAEDTHIFKVHIRVTRKNQVLSETTFEVQQLNEPATIDKPDGG